MARPANHEGSAAREVFVRTRWIDEATLNIKGDKARVRSWESKTPASGERLVSTPSGLRGNRDHAETATRTIQKGSASSMNKLETRYAQYLEAMKHAGEIKDWRFEPFRLKLAKDCTYCPDFFIVTKDGSFEVHETKGFMRDDAAVKLKVAVDIFPWWQFKLIKLVKGKWEIKAV